MGEGYRVVKHRKREVENESFVNFIKKESIDPTITMAYRMISPNIEWGLKSVAKYDRFEKDIDLSIWETACDWTARHFQPFVRGALVIGEEAAIDVAVKTTSPGWPWNLQFQRKRDLFENFQGKPSPMSAYWDDLVNLEPAYVPIWCVSEKKELRAILKIQQGKIRTFTASPVEHSIACSRLCLDFNERFYDSAGKHSSFVGATKYLGGFDRLYKRLSKHPNGYALDCSDYDASMSSVFLWAQCEFRISMLDESVKTPENIMRMRRMYYDTIYSVMVLETGALVRKSTGNPSGQGNTIVDNTFTLYRLLIYCWLRLSVLNGVLGANYDMFTDNVECVLTGDDNTFTVSDLVHPWFNGATIAAELLLIGVKATSDSWLPRPVIELDFLSQRWIRNGNVYLPYPETSKVLSSMRWGSKLDDVRWQLLRACALRMESWANSECREILSGYINHLLKFHGDSLTGVVSVPRAEPVQMRHILAQIRDDKWLWRLYTGLESGCSLKDSPDKNVLSVLSSPCLLTCDCEDGEDCCTKIEEKGQSGCQGNCSKAIDGASNCTF